MAKPKGTKRKKAFAGEMVVQKIKFVPKEIGVYKVNELMQKINALEEIVDRVTKKMVNMIHYKLKEEIVTSHKVKIEEIPIKLPILKKKNVDFIVLKPRDVDFLVLKKRRKVIEEPVYSERKIEEPVYVPREVLDVKLKPTTVDKPIFRDRVILVDKVVKAPKDVIDGYKKKRRKKS